MDVFEKLANLKRLVRKEIGAFSDEELYTIMEKLGNRWHYPNKRKKSVTLSNSETAIYELMLTNGYNPSTAYKWLLIDKSAPEIRFKVRTGVMTVREALQTRKEFKGLGTTSERELIKMISTSFERYLVR